MIYKITLALGLLVTSTAAFSCSPPTDRSLTSAEIAKRTNDLIKRSTVIVDAEVFIGDSGDRILKPLRIYKGPRHRFYRVINSDCGIYLLPGTKVRAILDGDESGWMMIAPLYDRHLRTRLFDSIVDDRLGNTRPKGFTNGSAPMPPVP